MCRILYKVVRKGLTDVMILNGDLREVREQGLQVSGVSVLGQREQPVQKLGQEPASCSRNSRGGGT